MILVFIEDSTHPVWNKVGRLKGNIRLSPYRLRLGRFDPVNLAGHEIKVSKAKDSRGDRVIRAGCIRRGGKIRTSALVTKSIRGAQSWRMWPHLISFGTSLLSDASFSERIRTQEGILVEKFIRVDTG